MKFISFPCFYQRASQWNRAEGSTHWGGKEGRGRSSHIKGKASKKNDDHRLKELDIIMKERA